RVNSATAEQDVKKIVYNSRAPSRTYQVPAMGPTGRRNGERWAEKRCRGHEKHWLFPGGECIQIFLLDRSPPRVAAREGAGRLEPPAAALPMTHASVSRLASKTR